MKKNNVPFFKYIISLQFVPCHRKRERSVVIFGKQFPICSRCMAILLGYFFIPFLLLCHLHIPILYGILCNVPMVVDGFTQRWKWRVSNNYLRVCTGLLSGFGLSIIVIYSAFFIVNLLIEG